MHERKLCSTDEFSHAMTADRRKCPRGATYQAAKYTFDDKREIMLEGSTLASAYSGFVGFAKSSKSTNVNRCAIVSI